MTSPSDASRALIRSRRRADFIDGANFRRFALLDEAKFLCELVRRAARRRERCADLPLQYNALCRVGRESLTAAPWRAFGELFVVDASAKHDPSRTAAVVSRSCSLSLSLARTRWFTRVAATLMRAEIDKLRRAVSGAVDDGGATKRLPMRCGEAMMF